MHSCSSYDHSEQVRKKCIKNSKNFKWCSWQTGLVPCILQPWEVGICSFLWHIILINHFLLFLPLLYLFQWQFILINHFLLFLPVFLSPLDYASLLHFSDHFLSPSLPLSFCAETDACNLTFHSVQATLPFRNLSAQLLRI